MSIANVESTVDEEFVLDMRVMETMAPLMVDCDTSDGCGSTCETSACTSGTASPA
ncbi:FxLD family lanthipeptide [Actinocorallia sp. API 0066]|uniref:FxLD family lanthipeptide n=1 Tax=Actinocorallia sp. API 0066 TaxID=2896846 RepID=UPI001E64F505|nr:FxLD family lanthipeptide [Actinocorallia sp. API 0066]MCD0449051.1 FxLD family lanthipeptide [Actinocorallia sp. API 0066]